MNKRRRRLPARTIRRGAHTSSRGQVLPIVGAGMLAFIMLSALVVDLGFSWMLVRHEQNAADASALAAARWVQDYDLGAGTYDATYGPQGPVPGPAGYMWQEACAAARANGFFAGATDNSGCVAANDGDRAATLTVNYPPKPGASGSYQGQPGYVQVIIAGRHESFFGRIVGSAIANVSASAVAANKTGTATAYSLIALDPTSCSSGKISGSITPVNSGVGGIYPYDAGSGGGMLMSIAQPVPGSTDALFAPKVSSFTPVGGSTTSSSTLTFSLVFDTGVAFTGTISSISNIGTSAGWSVTSVTADNPVGGYATSWTVVATTGSPLVAGRTIQLQLTSGTFRDAAGSTGPANSPGGRQSSPIVTISFAPGVSSFTTPSASTNQTSLSYTLTFSESVTGLTTTDLTVSGTGAGHGWAVTSVSPSGGSSSTFTIALGTNGEPLVAGDTVTLTLAANAVTGTYGSGPTSSRSASPTVTVEWDPPKVTVFGAVFVNSTCSQGSVPDGQCDKSGQGALDVAQNSGLTVTQGVWIAGNCRSATDGTVVCTNPDPTKCVIEGSTQLGDPLAQLGPPDVPDHYGMCNVALNLSAAGGCPTFQSGQQYVVSEGFFPGGWDIKPGAKIDLLPGLYYFGGGGVAVAPGGNTDAVIRSINPDGTVGGGVLIFSTDDPDYHAACLVSPTGGQADTRCQRGITFKGQVQLSPLQGGPYANLLLWMDNSASCPTMYNKCTVDLGGQGTTAAGTIYVPRWLLKMSGGASGGAEPVQIISWQFMITGGSEIVIDYDPDSLWHVDRRGLVH